MKASFISFLSMVMVFQCISFAEAQDPAVKAFEKKKSSGTAHSFEQSAVNRRASQTSPGCDRRISASTGTRSDACRLQDPRRLET